jgi:CIC family chloride channel protein
VFLATEKAFKPFSGNATLRILIGGVTLFVLILLLPPLFGEGYESIKYLSELRPISIFQNSVFSSFAFSEVLIYLMIFAVILLKPVATAVTLGAGGNGGNFAPALFLGAFVGYLFCSLSNELGIIHLPVSNFTLVAMAGVLSGIFHAPLTGIFIIAEVTGGYELIIPLMIVSALSYAVAKYFMPLSIDLTKLSEKENIYTTDTDSYLLSNIDLITFVERDFSEIPDNANLGELIEHITVSKRNLFPVLDRNSALIGLITIDDIREIMFKQDLYGKLTVNELMRRPVYVITEKDDIRSAMRMFDESHLWNIPVVINARYQGFISKSTILEKYREVLIQTSVE